MPIKGLSDRGLAFPEIGQIRKGAKKGEKGPGKDLTYFRVEFDELEKVAAANFREAYKDQPTAIRILLPFNEIERMWDPWLEAYTAGRLVARSDGEFITYQLDDKGEVIVHGGKDQNGNPVPHPANGIAGHDYKGNAVKFKPTGRLKVIVPELKRAAYLTVMTTSTHDIANISSQLAAFKELNNGQLAGIPFILRRRPKSISTPSDNGQRVRRIKWLLSIEVDPDWAVAKFGQLNTLALPSGIETPAPSGEIEEVVEWDDDEIVDEAQPEAENQDTGEPTPAIELVQVMGDWAVGEAAKFWNIPTAAAAVEIGKKLHGKMSKAEFTDWLTQRNNEHHI
jgi:hypothetical protein